MKFLISAVLGFSFFAIASATEVLPDELLQDESFSESVKLVNIEITDQDNDDESQVKAEIVGSGSITIYSRQRGGFPKIFVPGDTEVTNTRMFDQGRGMTYWDGVLATPEISINPSVKDVELEDSLLRTEGIKLTPIEAFSLGRENEVFDFSSEIHLAFQVPFDQTSRVWIARKDETDSEWIIEKGDFCLSQNGICLIKADSFHKIALFEESYTRCPDRPIQRGVRTGGTPKCAIVCDSGYTRDYAVDQCVLESKAENSEASVFSKTSGLGSEVFVRPGYFRWRESSGSQVGSQVNQDQIDQINDDTVRGRVARTEAERARRQGFQEDTESSEDRSLLQSLKNALENLEFEFWRNNTRLVPVSDNTMKEDESHAEIKQVNQNQPRTYSGILPRTGGSAFWSLFGLLALVLVLGIRKSFKK